MTLDANIMDSSVDLLRLLIMTVSNKSSESSQSTNATQLKDDFFIGHEV